MSAAPAFDFEARVRLLTREEGGADAVRAQDGARFEHALGEGLWVAGTHRYPDAGRAEPGEDVRARVRLRDAELHPRSLSSGTDLELRAEGRTVGHAHVLRIERALLDRDSSAEIPVEDATAAICGLVWALQRSGGSLRERIASSGLGASLSQIDAQRLTAELAAHRDRVDAWYAWAEQHRLRAGPFLFRYGEGGWAGVYEPSGLAMQSARFEDPVRACAEFIALELQEGFLLDALSPR